MERNKKSQEVRTSAGVSNKESLTGRLAPPLTEAASMFIKPKRLPTPPETIPDRKVKFLGTVGDSEWSRMHRIAGSNVCSKAIKLSKSVKSKGASA